MIKQWDKRWRSNLTLATESIGREIVPVAYNAGIEYHILSEDQFYVHASLAGNSKYPSLNDLYFRPGGNPFLRPERSLNQEAGFHYGRKEKNILIVSDITAYMSRVTDWILWLPTFKGYWEPGNIEEVNVRGVETNMGISGNIAIIRYKINAVYAMTRSVNHGDNDNAGDVIIRETTSFHPSSFSELYCQFDL